MSRRVQSAIVTRPQQNTLCPLMFRFPLSVVSPAGSRGRLSILIFHRVLASRDPLDPSLPVATEFEREMRWIRDWFNVLPLGLAVERLFAGSLPSRALAVTFDDGYADNETIAAPILNRLGMTATFFVSTGYLDGGCMWNDRVIEAMRACARDSIDLTSLDLGVYVLATPANRCAAVDSVLDRIKHLDPPRRQAVTDSIVELAGGAPMPQLMMQPEQVRGLVGLGMDIGGHTVTHPILARLSAADAYQEMEDGKKALEGILGQRVQLFAYPNGIPDLDYGAEHIRMARACGFVAAVSTAWGAASMRSDRFQMPRFTPWERTRFRYGARLLANLRRTEKRAA